MSEQEYLDIPLEIRERYLTAHNITRETNDWQKNMEDPLYCELFNKRKELSKQLSEREYQLRENRRKQAVK